MTDERLQEIRERLESVTPWPAPWMYLGCTEANIAPCVMCQGVELLDLVSCNGLTAREDRLIGRFVAHARQDVPDLLAEVERLRQEVSLLQGIVSDQQQESGLYGAGWNAAIAAASKDAHQMALRQGIDRTTAGIIRNSVTLLKLLA